MLRTRSPLLVALYTILHSPFSSEQSPGAASTILKQHSSIPSLAAAPSYPVVLCRTLVVCSQKCQSLPCTLFSVHFDHTFGRARNEAKKTGKHFPPQLWHNRLPGKMRSSAGLGKKQTKGRSPSTGRLTVHQGEALVSQKKTEQSVKTVEKVSDMIDLPTT